MRTLIPLAIVVVLALLVARIASEPQRLPEQRRIEGLWEVAVVDPSRLPELQARIDDWERAFGDDEAGRAFVARARLRAGQLEEAIVGFFGEDASSLAEGSTRQFGRILLHRLGFVGAEGYERPLDDSIRVAHMLFQGGDEEARAWVLPFVERTLRTDALGALFEMWMRPDEPLTLDVAAALRRQDTVESLDTAAVLAMRPEPYPGRDGDLERLTAVVTGTLRWREPLVWAMACLSLGRSEDARALHTLRTVRLALGDLDQPQDATDALTCAVGLLAGGAWNESEAALRSQQASPDAALARVWYSEALTWRLSRGDARAVPALRALWRGFTRHPDPAVEARIAFRILLDGPLPEPGAAELVSEVTGRLANPAAGPEHHALHLSWLARNGDPKAFPALLFLLRDQARRGALRSDPTSGNPVHTNPILAAARALYLYEPTGSADT